MESESKCNVCEKTFNSVGALTNHTNKINAHDGMRRNSLNEIVFACNVCDKTYTSQKKLGSHRKYSKHALPDTLSEHAAGEIESMEEPAAAGNICTNSGNIPSDVWEDKERVIMLKVCSTLVNVQDVVKHAFYSLRDEIIPLYTSARPLCSEHIEAWERVGKVLKPFEDGLHTTLMQYVFIVSRKLNNDLESL